MVAGGWGLTFGLTLIIFQKLNPLIFQIVAQRPMVLVA